MKPYGRVKVRYKHSGLDRYDETTGEVTVDPELRTVSYDKVDGITVEYPIEALLFWEFAPILYEQGVRDARLKPEVVVKESAQPRPEGLDWPTNPSLY
jgi:hypothetical protein